MIRIFIVILLFASNSFADEKDDCSSYINNLLKDSFNILNNKSLTDKAKIEHTQVLLFKNLDLEWMAKFTLGRNRLNLNQNKFQSFCCAYSKYITYSYSNAVKHYRGQSVSIKQIERMGDNEFIVRTRILTSSNSTQELKVDYMVRKFPSCFKVFDVITEGISLIRVQQSEFSSVLYSQGIDVLIQDLIEKTKR